MADEAAVAEPPVAPAEAPAQPAETPASEPTAAAPEEGAAAQPAPESQSVLREFFKSIKTPEEFAAALEEVPEEIRAPLQQEWQRKGEVRRERQQGQIARAKEGRLGAWKPHADNYDANQAFLQSVINRAKDGDMTGFSDIDQLVTTINSYRAGAVGKVILQNEAYVDSLIEKYLPDLTPDEESQLEKPLYEFGRTGVAADLVPLVTELAIARREAAAFEKGVQKGLKDREAKAAIAERVANIQKLKNELPGIQPAGAAPSAAGARAQIQQDIAEIKAAINEGRMDPATYQERMTDIQNRIAALPQE